MIVRGDLREAQIERLRVLKFEVEGPVLVDHHAAVEILCQRTNDRLPMVVRTNRAGKVSAFMAVN